MYVEKEKKSFTNVCKKGLWDKERQINFMYGLLIVKPRNVDM